MVGGRRVLDRGGVLNVGPGLERDAQPGRRGRSRVRVRKTFVRIGRGARACGRIGGAVWVRVRMRMRVRMRVRARMIGRGRAVGARELRQLGRGCGRGRGGRGRDGCPVVNKVSRHDGQALIPYQSCHATREPTAGAGGGLSKAKCRSLSG